MRVGKIMGAVVAASVAMTPVAASAAQSVGSIVTVNGDAFVAREGRIVHAQPSMSVHAGDRVITRAGSSANIALGGCSVSVAGGEMKTISGGSCGSVQTASFSRAASQTSGASAYDRHGGGFVLIGLGALALIILGIIIALRKDKRPTSP